MSSKILIVGGAGFIGSNVNKLLNKKGYQTVIFDNLSKGCRDTVVCGSFVKGDLANTNEIDQVLQSQTFNAVMHFAAWTDVGESVANPDEYYQNNVVNTLNLLRSMLKHNIKNFIFSSSAAVYGNPQTTPISEAHPCHPINPYGFTKLMVEQILKDLERAYGLHYCSFRYFNAAGGDPDGEIKNHKKKENNLIPLALKSLLDPKGSITVYGSDYATSDGTCIRDYIHVSDIGDAHISGMERLFSGAPSATYNLGNGQGYSVKEVLKAVESVTGRQLNIINGERRAGDPPILVADAGKACSELQWHPKYPKIERMVEDAWNTTMRTTCTN